MKARPTQSRKGVKGQLPLAGSRDSVPCGVWGNAPTVPRATSMLNALNQGAGSEASLPVTLRSRRSALKLHIRPLTYCRARWARPTSMGNDLFSRCWPFLLQEVSPLRRRVGDFAVAPDAPSHCTSMFLDFSRCRGNRACGRESGALRSPPTPLRSAHPCSLTVIVSRENRNCPPSAPQSFPHAAAPDSQTAPPAPGTAARRPSAPQTG